MLQPLVSIITPSFNQDKFIEKTILSVLNQIYPNIEYIVMDGGSTDNSVDIIKKYADNITYWQSAPDKGQTDAINQASRNRHFLTGIKFLQVRLDNCQCAPGFRYA